MTGHQPAQGETIGFFVCAGDCRNHSDDLACARRSNVVLVPMQFSGAVSVLSVTPAAAGGRQLVGEPRIRDRSSTICRLATVYIDFVSADSAARDLAIRVCWARCARPIRSVPICLPGAGATSARNDTP